jgi:hypothetical protein|tara:strand:+ start:271 stop:555 length:285 start_codon:yes stop_codon:yes gene_type:complete
MKRNSWIVKQMFADAKNNLGWVFKGVLVAGGFVAGIKILTFFNMPKEIVFPVMWIAFIVLMAYKWYSMKYDWSKEDKAYDRASKKYTNKLKELK